MDCVVEAGIPSRRPSSHPPRSPSYCVGGGSGACNTSYCGHRGSCADATVPLSDAAIADLVEDPLLQQQHPEEREAHAIPSLGHYAELDPTVHRHSDDEQQEHQQQQPSDTQSAKYISFSTCGDSSSNLTTLCNTNTNTNTSTSVTGSSEESTPLSGASSHQQQLIRARAQRTVTEANQHLSSLNSRSSSAHGDHEKEDEEGSSHITVPPYPKLPKSVSPAATIVALSHFTCRSIPLPKPPRQQQKSPQQKQENPIVGAAVAPAMHIPDLTTFADSSSTRNDTAMTTSNSVSPVAAGPNGGAVRAVHDAVDYEGEIDCAVQKTEQQEDNKEDEGRPRWQQEQQKLQQRERNDAEAHDLHASYSTPATTIATMKVVPTMTAGSNSATHGVAPDATPQEPPPKRFATSDDDTMEAMFYTVEHQTKQVQHHDAENEEMPERRPISVRRRRRAAQISSTDDTSNGEGEDEMMMSGNSSSNTRPSDRGSSTASRGVSQGHKQQQKEKADKESRRKYRVISNGGESITASISYDPTRFNTPPLAEQPQQLQSGEDSLTQGTSSIATKLVVERHRSETQPSCATPPEADVYAKPAAPPQQAFPPPPPAPTIKLTEPRYAFLALSFMMRMLCKLHKGEPIPSSDFHSHCIPPMSVTMYVQRLVRYCACSGEALLCAFVLLLKYVFHSGHPITIYNAHRLLITSVLLGIKLRDDVYFSNVYYGRIGGISGREMNKLEVLFLSKLEWEAQVHEEEYAALLRLLEELAIDADPTPEQLASFAAAFPEKVAAYVLDEDDDEVEEAAAKLQQGSSSSSTLTGTAAATTNDKTSASTATTSLPHVQQRKVLRGAYRLHQWHTLVEPWMAQLKQHVFAVKDANAKAAAAARQEEGVRWEQYYREDEETAARLQRENSAGAWVSPLSVQQRATSTFTVTAVNPSHSSNTAGNGKASTGVWSAEPPYQSNWPSADAIPYYNCNVNSSNSYSGQQQQETNPRCSNFINFANVVAAGYFGSTATSGSGGAHHNASPASLYQHQQQLQSTAPSYHYGAGANHRVSNAPMGAAGWNAVRYHTATERAPRPTSSTFDITNRAATSVSSETTPAHTRATRTGSGTDSATNNNNGPGSERSTQCTRTNSSTIHHPQQLLPSVTVRAASPTSSTTPGSGINVNAQPYYYVSSRMRKQQQQPKSSTSTTASAALECSPSSTNASPTRSSNTLVEADTTSTSSAICVAAQSAASPAETNRPSSSSSSFISAACANPSSHVSNYPSSSSVTATAQTTNENNDNTAPKTSSSSGVEAVLAAMKRGSTTIFYNADNEKVVGHVDRSDGNRSSSSRGGTTGASHMFPARPIAKSMVGSHEGEQAAVVHVPRRSPQTVNPSMVHRRSTYASQHSLGKKRSKPDSYKDY